MICERSRASPEKVDPNFPEELLHHYLCCFISMLLIFALQTGTIVCSKNDSGTTELHSSLNRCSGSTRDEENTERPWTINKAIDHMNQAMRYPNGRVFVETRIQQFEEQKCPPCTFVERRDIASHLNI